MVKISIWQSYGQKSSVLFLFGSQCFHTTFNNSYRCTLNLSQDMVIFIRENSEKKLESRYQYSQVILKKNTILNV